MGVPPYEWFIMENAIRMDDLWVTLFQQTSIDTDIYTWIYVYIYINTYTYIYIYIQMMIYIYTYISIYLYLTSKFRSRSTCIHHFRFTLPKLIPALPRHGNLPPATEGFRDVAGGKSYISKWFAKMGRTLQYSPCMFACTCIYIYIYIHTHAHVHYIYIYTCTCVYIHIFRYMYLQ